MSPGFCAGNSGRRRPRRTMSAGRCVMPSGVTGHYTASVPEIQRLPAYRTIETELRRRVELAQPGQRLPSETQLCREFAVSRMPARAAMTRLVEDGLVYRESGRGAFVAPQRHLRRADRLVSCSGAKTSSPPTNTLASSRSCHPCR
jgi:hypothetical protein